MCSTTDIQSNGIAPVADDGERQLLDDAVQWLGACKANPTVDVLGRLSTERGIDFATAVAYQSVRNSPTHHPFIRRIEELGDDDVPTTRTSGFRVVIVPGAFYREYPDTGANGNQLIAQLTKLGYPVEVLPLDSFGRITDGARRIREWLACQDGPPIVLVSLSKGGAEVKLALAANGMEFNRVIAWIDLSGILEGTALIDWLRRHRLRYLAVRGIIWWRGYHSGGLDDLRRGERTLLADPLELPSHLLAIHVLGFPLRRYLQSAISRRGHKRLSDLGPNDGGGILLGDAIQRSGLIYPVWSADHYLRPQWDIRRLVARLLRYVEQEASCPIG